MVRKIGVWRAYSDFRNQLSVSDTLLGGLNISE